MTELRNSQSYSLSFISSLVGFELYSMVPSICPLETLHNALFLKQVDDFLASIASPSTEVLRKVPEMSSMATRSSPGMRRKISLNTYTPTKILPTPPAALKSSKASSKAAAGGPSQAMAPHTSSRKKSINSKTEGHEPKKSTGKKRWAHTRTESFHAYKGTCCLAKRMSKKPWLKLVRASDSCVIMLYFIHLCISLNTSKARGPPVFIQTRSSGRI